MFQLLRAFTALQEEEGGADDAAIAPANPDHYLWFRGIPNPPDDYQAPDELEPYIIEDWL